LSDPSLSLLVLSGIGVPPFSARNITQTLDMIAQSAVMRRTVNGRMVNLAPPQFRKYKSAISGSDQDTGAFSGVFPGLAVTVDCVQELAFPTVRGRGADDRTAVPGTERVRGDHTFYCPRLDMVVTAGPTASWDEAAGVNTWSIELEEV
jgi:hypothetical protein